MLTRGHGRSQRHESICQTWAWNTGGTPSWTAPISFWIERQLLDRYHEALLLNGVRDYDRGELDADCRFLTLWQITWPVWQAEYGIPPVIWWNNMERAMLAVDDVGCRDLLV